MVKRPKATWVIPVPGLLALVLTAGACTSSSANSVAAPTTTAAASGLGQITSKLEGSGSLTFAAVYAVSGNNSEASTIEFAQKPPNSYSFVTTKPDGTKSELISDGAAAYSCRQAASAWTCASLPADQFRGLVDAFQIYRGSFWASDLAALSANAAAGVTVTPSTLSSAGVQLQCVTYAGGPAGPGGEICVSRAGILGYVHDVSTDQTFKLTSYTTSPDASVFAVPTGATVTTIP
jgi:hypothetical protein